jgi:hypothetical protein
MMLVSGEITEIQQLRQGFGLESFFLSAFIMAIECQNKCGLFPGVRLNRHAIKAPEALGFSR